MQQQKFTSLFIIVHLSHLCFMRNIQHLIQASSQNEGVIGYDIQTRFWDTACVFVEGVCVFIFLCRNVINCIILARLFYT